MAEPDLDDPSYARFAWGRFRRLLGWMAVASALTACVALVALRYATGPLPLPLHMAIASFLGVFFTVLLAATLMGLVFLSSGTGHDDRIIDPMREDN